MKSRTSRSRLRAEATVSCSLSPRPAATSTATSSCLSPFLVFEQPQLRPNTNQRCSVLVSPGNCYGRRRESQRRAPATLVRGFDHAFSHIRLPRLCRVKEARVGEGTYAVVFQGAYTHFSALLSAESEPGREKATGRKIAIKKIKVGEFKDGLDMSAIREVKYLRELRHPNVIEVRPASSFIRTQALNACLFSYWTYFLRRRTSTLCSSSWIWTSK